MNIQLVEDCELAEHKGNIQFLLVSLLPNLMLGTTLALSDVFEMA